MSDRWTFHGRALRFAELGADEQNAHLQQAEFDEGAPFPGFWRARLGRGAELPPIATWDAEPEAPMFGRPVQVAMIGRRVRPEHPWTLQPVSSLMVWRDLQCWQNPVSEEQFRAAVASGAWWDARPPQRWGERAARVHDVLGAAPITPRRAK